ncbi:hypothetical protein ACQP2P_44080 [Dactylosporangium sp. CA-139114]|uniref:hypothetical protein n=1 Tax=Dactylosporangium sp. CA-139114 TaxID=3239931 RepID=UPI003D96C210
MTLHASAETFAGRPVVDVAPGEPLPEVDGPAAELPGVDVDVTDQQVEGGWGRYTAVCE